MCDIRIDLRRVNGEGGKEEHSKTTSKRDYVNVEKAVEVVNIDYTGRGKA